MNDKPAAGSEEPVNALAVSEETAQAETEKVEAKSTPETKTTEAPVADDPKVSEAAKTLAEAKKQKAQTSLSRWNKMNDERSEALARADKAEKELADFKAKIKTPVASEYDDNAKYTADTVQHTLDKNEAARRESEIKNRRESAQEIQVRQINERIADAVDRFPEFQTKVMEGKVAITPVMVEAMASSPYFAEIGLALADNVAEARKIASMTPAEQWKAIGKLEAGLENPPPKKVTQAPEPINSVKGKGGNSAAFDYVNSSMDDYARQRKKDAKDG